MTSYQSNKVIDVPIRSISNANIKNELAVHANSCVGKYLIRQPFLDFTHVCLLYTYEIHSNRYLFYFETPVEFICWVSDNNVH